MTLDRMIKEIDICVDTWHDGFSDKDLNRLSRWLKELKSLRKENTALLARLKKENLGLRDLVKRLADKLETESERPYLVESLIKEARELKDIDKIA